MLYLMTLAFAWTVNMSSLFQKEHPRETVYGVVTGAAPVGANTGDEHSVDSYLKSLCDLPKQYVYHYITGHRLEDKKKETVHWTVDNRRSGNRDQ